MVGALYFTGVMGATGRLLGLLDELNKLLKLKIDIRLLSIDERRTDLVQRHCVKLKLFYCVNYFVLLNVFSIFKLELLTQTNLIS